MRISRLDLRRYGKFTDQSIDLPAATRDFHLIVGPNEAGKSTLRNAIQDLFFGIETRSRYNFIHPHSEMNLAARIEQEGNTLDFVRTKARTKTLQSATGSALTDNALLPFIGPVDRNFFDQMFGLNHERLVTGGQEILSASNDIGQILFQAAAGIGSMGEIRDRLEAEADALWAKRKSSDREYYIANAELEQAEAMLKQATVRTKDWQEARSKVDQLGDELKLARERFQTLEKERVQLERVRRIAPLLMSISETEARLAALGDVVLFPDTAAEQLATAEREIAIATQSLDQFTTHVNALQCEIEAIKPDESILARAEDIEALAETRQLLRNHDGDIGKREDEVRVLRQAIQDLARQLAWGETDETAIGEKLPGTLVRVALADLVRRHEALWQAKLTAEDSLKKRNDEIKAISAEISALPATDIPVSLSAALVSARALGDIESQVKRSEAQISRLKRDLADTKIELGAWNPNMESLRKLLPPNQDEIQALVKKSGELELALSNGGDRVAEVGAEIRLLGFEISQYRTAHQPVTLSEIHQSRAERDSIWHDIKGGSRALLDAAAGYEAHVLNTDTLSDKRHDKAKEETELQSRIDRLQLLQLKSADLSSRLIDLKAALAEFNRDWQQLMSSIGLSGMPLLKLNDWRMARDRVLAAVDAVAEAEATKSDIEQSIHVAKSALADEVSKIEPGAGDLGLAALILLADQIVSKAARTEERRNALTLQKARADAVLPDLESRIAQATEAVVIWRSEFQKNLSLAFLPADASVSTTESALLLFEEMHQRIQKIREIRTNRIDLMQRDLDLFKNSAVSLASEISPELVKESPAAIALALAGRMKQAIKASEDLVRLQSDINRAQAQAKLARNRIAEAHASLDPLLRLSGAPDHDVLRDAIDKSDQSRLLSMELHRAMTHLLQAGDGLDHASLRAEFASSDISTITTRLSEIKLIVEDVVSQQNRLSGELTSAETILGAIAGRDEAAKAESLRQQALARMANATDRYIKVFTAAKLLRWSIERFRESKQGPMLARASEIFHGLTQGAFSRLVVDYEAEPLKLSGLRASGGSVDIDGMSEGTRDQLYLALRLAALELHLDQTIALPFIADDLFINYDDGRAKAGLEALAKLSEKTQVIFLTHHEHLISVAQSVFGGQHGQLKLNVVRLH